MFFVMMLRYPGVMIDLPVYYLCFWRAGVVVYMMYLYGSTVEVVHLS